MIDEQLEAFLKSGFIVRQSRLLSDSYRQLTGRDLLKTNPLVSLAEALFEAPFVLVSHDTRKDPVFNYGNRMALALFDLGWFGFTQLPSRKSAETPHRTEREELLARASQFGYIDDYTGVRISSSGKRFRIEKATIWNLLDEKNEYRGQAAVFSHWTPITGLGPG